MEKYILESYVNGQIQCHFTYYSKEDAINVLCAIIKETMFLYINENIKITYQNNDNNIEAIIERDGIKETISINSEDIDDNTEVQ